MEFFFILDNYTFNRPCSFKSSKLKYFEVAIWEETSSVHLYEFPNDYDPDSGEWVEMMPEKVGTQMLNFLLFQPNRIRPFCVPM